MAAQQTEKTPITPLIVSITQAAKIAGISQAEAYRKIKVGQFPLPVRITEKRRGIRMADLEAWVAALPTTIPHRVGRFKAA
jgi:predicted DNA-binding transcriptional regulator AlpA